MIPQIFLMLPDYRIFLSIFVTSVFYLEYPYKEYPSHWCGSQWASDSDDRITGIPVDQCKDICSATTGCSMITHATKLDIVENICVLCTPGYGIGKSIDQWTTYAKTGKISTPECNSLDIAI